MPPVDWETIRQYGPWAVIAFAAFYYKDLWLPWVKKLFGGIAPNAAPSLQNATGNVSDLIAYFQAVGCPEGVKAARLCGECLFHESHAEHKT